MVEREGDAGVVAEGAVDPQRLLEQLARPRDVPLLARRVGQAHQRIGHGGRLAERAEDGEAFLSQRDGLPGVA